MGIFSILPNSLQLFEHFPIITYACLFTHIHKGSLHTD